MRESTARWLNPMITEAQQLLIPVDISALMYQASMPAREVDWAAEGKWDPAAFLPDVPGVVRSGIDWIMFGQLLRAELGWELYPDVPPDFPLPGEAPPPPHTTKG